MMVRLGNTVVADQQARLLFCQLAVAFRNILSNFSIYRIDNKGIAI